MHQQVFDSSADRMTGMSADVRTQPQTAAGKAVGKDPGNVRATSSPAGQVLGQYVTSGWLHFI